MPKIFFIVGQKIVADPTKTRTGCFKTINKSFAPHSPKKEAKPKF